MSDYNVIWVNDAIWILLSKYNVFLQIVLALNELGLVLSKTISKVSKTFVFLLLTLSLGTIKASHVVVLNENSCTQHDPHLQIEFDFVEKHKH